MKKPSVSIAQPILAKGAATRVRTSYSYGSLSGLRGKTGSMQKYDVV